MIQRERETGSLKNLRLRSDLLDRRHLIESGRRGWVEMEQKTQLQILTGSLKS